MYRKSANKANADVFFTQHPLGGKGDRSSEGIKVGLEGLRLAVQQVANRGCPEDPENDIFQPEGMGGMADGRPSIAFGLLRLCSIRVGLLPVPPTVKRDEK